MRQEGSVQPIVSFRSVHFVGCLRQNMLCFDWTLCCLWILEHTEHHRMILWSPLGGSSPLIEDNRFSPSHPLPL